MVVKEEVTKSNFIERYAKGELENVMEIEGKVYGRTVIGCSELPDGFKVVWAAIP